MGTFATFRDVGWNTYYGPQRHAANVDVTHVIIAYFTVIVGACLLIFFISSRGKERWGSLLRLLFNLHTGVSILLSLTGRHWLVSDVITHCQYSTVLNDVTKAHLGLHVGLKGVNVTMSTDKNTTSPLASIYYNEEFSFVGVSDVRWSAHDARHKGLPYAILYVIEYFEADSGGLRWSRILRSAGHYAYIILWVSFVLWFVSQILTSVVVTRGATMTTVSGVAMVSACVLYHLLQPATPLVVPFSDTFMQLRYGWCFWLTTGSGVCTMLYGLALILLHHWFPAVTSAILLSDAARDECRECYVTAGMGASAPLQIMTPYQERKKRQDLYKNFFTNEGFVDEIPMASSTKAADDLEDVRRNQLSDKSECSLSGSSVVIAETSNGHFQRNLTEAEAQEWDEIPPDYSSESDVDESGNDPSPEQTSHTVSTVEVSYQDETMKNG